MINQISVSVASGPFSNASAVHSRDDVLLYHSRFTASHIHTLLSKYLLQSVDAMLPTALGFPKGKRVTGDCSILVLEAVGFFQKLLPSSTRCKSKRKAEI